MAKAKAVVTATVAAIPSNGNGASDSALVRSFKSARRVSTPIVAIETPDAAATIALVRRTLPDKTPVLSWDCAKGLRGLNEPGKAAFAGLGIDVNTSVNATETLLALELVPEFSVVFMHNFQRQLSETSVIQALWNLRDAFKMNKRTIVALGPEFQLPAELSGDVIVLEEPLPTRADLSGILDQQFKNMNEALAKMNEVLKAQGQPEHPLLPMPDETTRMAALDAVVGLSSYTAEQVMAMAVEKTGIDIPKCWERKIKSLENDGVTVLKPVPNDTSLAELKGLDNVVAYANELIAAEAFNVIVFMDEMDKSMAGGMAEHVGDGGAARDQVQQLLTYINDTKSLGLMLAGLAGSGKTQLVKAMGAASGKPVIVLDLGGAKAAGGGILGQAEARIRHILRVITATAEGRVLFIGTANRTTMFTPEMNRRFRKQFYFDQPTDAARAAIWPVYVAKNGLTPSQAAIPPGFDDGWTGAEIQAACEEAALFGKSVVDAARYIIPQAVSAKAVIAQMRRDAAGKFLSASHPGFYQIPVEAAQPVSQRSIDMEMN